MPCFARFCEPRFLTLKTTQIAKCGKIRQDVLFNRSKNLHFFYDGILAYFSNFVKPFNDEPPKGVQKIKPKVPISTLGLFTNWILTLLQTESFEYSSNLNWSFIKSNNYQSITTQSSTFVFRSLEKTSITLMHTSVLTTWISSGSISLCVIGSTSNT